MVHPLYRSKNGAILWKELPEALRLFDNATDQQPGDLQLYLDGFGHLLDRFEATLDQYYADGFAAADPSGKSQTEMQGWIVPYMADLFGVTLYGPDADSRRTELQQAIWTARRRGSRIAVDAAAESILETSVVAVPGLDRVLRRPSLQDVPLLALELTGRAHPKDKLLLGEALPANATPSAMRQHHPGLPYGMRHLAGHMRAVEADSFTIDVDSRPVGDGTGQLVPKPYRVIAKAAAPCFSGSYEDRALRTPDIRRPAANRRTESILSVPDAVVLHVMPPFGIFFPGMAIRNRLPILRNGRIAPSPPEATRDVLYRPSGTNTELRLTSSNRETATQQHTIEDLRLDGTLSVAEGCRVRISGCAIRHLILAPDCEVDLVDSVFETVTAQVDPPKPDAHLRMEYVTVMQKLTARSVLASDCIFAEIDMASGGWPGCFRFSRIGDGDVAPGISLHRVTEGPIPFLVFPCLPKPGGGLGPRVARFGEAGYAVLSDHCPVELAQGAEDGSEPGVHHGRFHLARLRAAERRAQDYAPAGMRVLGRYDLRLAAPLPRLS